MGTNGRKEIELTMCRDVGEGEKEIVDLPNESEYIIFRRLELGDIR